MSSRPVQKNKTGRPENRNKLIGLKNTGIAFNLPIKTKLDEALRHYHQAHFMSWDPLEFVHQWRDPLDQEAVAILGGVLAHGRVAQIRNSLSQLVEKMKFFERSPSRFIQKLSLNKIESNCLSPWKHRFNNDQDLLLLMTLIGRSWNEHGSVGAQFCKGLKTDDVHVQSALETLIQTYKCWAAEHSFRYDLQPSAGFGFLLTPPSSKSTCKRWLMILRWLGRRDDIDLGLWCQQSPLAGVSKSVLSLRSDQLLMPLDTHTGRISQSLGLTQRKSLNWNTVLEVTQNLRKYDSIDPIKYDFALCKLGMLEGSK